MRKTLKKVITAVALLSLLSACSEDKAPPVEIAINPWPGYEFLYLAEQKGFFEELGLNVRLIQLPSLSDVQRAYINGYADGMASTAIEAVLAQSMSDRDLKIIMVTDYSNGGDVIISHKEIGSIKALKGKRIGAEVSSLGIFVLQRALAKNGLNLSDIELVNIEQSKGGNSIANRTIDAFVSYPPTSINILNNTESHIIFSSNEIPGEIIDTVAVSKDILEANPHLTEKLHQAWQMALDYYQVAPKDAATIMAKRGGISIEEFQATLGDLKILSSAEQKAIFREKQSLVKSVKAVCHTLTHTNSINEDCENFPDIVYSAPL